ncbi:hypothetical protein SBV1_350006 [Verrucomicrobia bacterium]|nr:hypothetical protein SBV1_350006 [Verrucomicrobiota bacterium]
MGRERRGGRIRPGPLVSQVQVTNSESLFNRKDFEQEVTQETEIFFPVSVVSVCSCYSGSAVSDEARFERWGFYLGDGIPAPRAFGGGLV